MTLKQINVWSDEVENAVRTILDFVERWNKQDKEQNVAEAARLLAEKLAEKESICLQCNQPGHSFCTKD